MIKINLIEDTEGYDDALKYEIEVPLNAAGYQISITRRADGAMIEQDLIAGIDILVVDYDLGDEAGDDVIAKVNDFPEYRSLPVIFYSGGEPVDSLRAKTRNYGHVNCSTKEDVGETLINLIKSRSW